MTNKIPEGCPLGDTDRESSKNYIEIRTPFGFNIKFGGRELFSVIMVTTLAAVIAFFINAHDVAASDSNKAVIEALNANKRAVTDALKEQREVTEALIYMMTLSDEEKKKLQFSKPKRIRDLEYENFYNNRYKSTHKPFE